MQRLPAETAEADLRDRLLYIRARALFRVNDPVPAVQALVKRESVLQSAAIVDNRRMLWIQLTLVHLYPGLAAHLNGLDATSRGWLELALLLGPGCNSRRPGRLAWALSRPSRHALRRPPSQWRRRAAGGTRSALGHSGATDHPVDAGATRHSTCRRAPLRQPPARAAPALPVEAEALAAPVMATPAMATPGLIPTTGLVPGLGASKPTLASASGDSKPGPTPTPQVPVAPAVPAIPLPPPGHHRVALILPLTGRLRAQAQSLQVGVEAAARRAGDVQVVLYDSGTGEAPEALVARARQAGASAIIGPVRREDVLRLARGAPPLPVLALNYTDGPPPRNLVPLGLAADDEARAAARLALHDGHRRAVLIAYEGDQGTRALATLRGHFRRRRGHGGRAPAVCAGPARLRRPDRAASAPRARPPSAASHRHRYLYSRPHQPAIPPCHHPTPICFFSSRTRRRRGKSGPACAPENVKLAGYAPSAPNEGALDPRSCRPYKL